MSERIPDELDADSFNIFFSLNHSVGAYVANWTRVFLACKNVTPNAFWFFTFF